MLRIVWGCFIIFAGFCSFGYALSSTSMLAAFRMMGGVPGLSGDLVKMTRQWEIFSYLLALFLWLTGSYLIHWGEKERQEDLIHRIRLLSSDR